LLFIVSDEQIMEREQAVMAKSKESLVYDVELDDEPLLPQISLLFFDPEASELQNIGRPTFTIQQLIVDQREICVDVSVPAADLVLTFEPVMKFQVSPSVCKSVSWKAVL
jgi:hypothetical protein